MMESNGNKSDFLVIVRGIIVLIAIIGGIATLISKLYIQFGIITISTIIIFVTLTVFKIIIDLLESIEKKIDKQ